MNEIILGDALEALKTLAGESIDCCITSPPYWNLRDYSVAGQIGLETTFGEYILKLCDIFDEVKRVLKSGGTIWVVLGDTYGTQSGAMRDGKFGKKNTNNQQFIQSPGVHKSLCQIPSRFAIEMTERGWILRNEIVWHKPNCMPSSADDRFTVDFEKVFFFVKNKNYWFKQQFDKYTKPMNRWGGDNLEATGESTWDNGTGQETYRDRNMRPNPAGKNKRTVWEIPTKPFKEAHFATFPEALIEPMILAGCPPGGIVLDPFMGAGTAAVVAKKLGRNYLGIELNPEYIKIARKRIDGTTPPLSY